MYSETGLLSRLNVYREHQGIGPAVARSAGPLSPAGAAYNYTDACVLSVIRSSFAQSYTPSWEHVGCFCVLKSHMAIPYKLMLDNYNNYRSMQSMFRASEQYCIC